MRRRLIALGIGLAVAASGCVGLPSLPPDHRVPLERVVDHIQCELQEAVRAASSTLRGFADDWDAGFNLTLKTRDNAFISPGLTFIVPLDPGETFRPGLGASVDNSATRTSKLNFRVTSLRSLLDTYQCPDIVKTGDPLLNGLGIQDLLVRGLGATGADDAVFYDRPNSIAQTIEFEVVTSTTLTPGLVLIRLTGLGTAGASRRSTNTLDIAFARKPPPTVQAPIRVIIVGDEREAAPRRLEGAAPAPRITVPAPSVGVEDALRELQLERSPRD